MKDKSGDRDVHTLLLYIRRTTNNDLLYSTGMSTQISVATCMRKKSNHEYMYMYNLNYSAIHLRLTQYCKSTLHQLSKLNFKNGEVRIQRQNSDIF